jgi:hypothetical protein
MGDLQPISIPSSSDEALLFSRRRERIVFIGITYRLNGDADVPLDQEELTNLIRILEQTAVVPNGDELIGLKNLANEQEPAALAVRWSGDAVTLGFQGDGDEISGLLNPHQVLNLIAMLSQAQSLA